MGSVPTELLIWVAVVVWVDCQYTCEVTFHYADNRRVTQLDRIRPLPRSLRRREVYENMEFYPTPPRIIAHCILHSRTLAAVDIFDL